MKKYFRKYTKMVTVHEGKHLDIPTEQDHEDGRLSCLPD